MPRKSTPAPEAVVTEAIVEETPAPEATPEATPAPSVTEILATFVAARKAVAEATATLVDATESVALVVRGKREELGLTRPPVARKAGITIAQLAGIELGRQATKDELVALGTALGIAELAAL